jgi:hypothetical protein
MRSDAARLGWRGKRGDEFRSGQRSRNGQCNAGQHAQDEIRFEHRHKIR